MKLTKEDWDRFEKEAEEYFPDFMIDVGFITDLKDAYVCGYKLGSANRYELKK